MQIKIDLKIFIFVVIFCFTHQIEIYVLLMLFALLHELGHLIAGVMLKLKPKKIQLNPCGVEITFENISKGINKKIPQKRILIALAGPLVNLFLIIIALFLPLGIHKDIIIYANVILLFVNLLPIYPLDGGRILKNILHRKLGYWEAVEITNKISNLITVILTITASISIFYFKNIAILLIILYLWMLIIKENRRYKLLNNAHNILEKDEIGLEKLQS